MAISQPVGTPTADLPEGVWHVDPKASRLTFSSRGMFGLVAVHGSFGTFQGELEVEGRNEKRTNARGQARRTQILDAALEPLVARGPRDPTPKTG